MKRFNPRRASTRSASTGPAITAATASSGVTDVATCIDCHSVHDIRRKAHPDRRSIRRTSPRPAAMPLGSEADGALRTQFPIDQYARWKPQRARESAARTRAISPRRPATIATAITARRLRASAASASSAAAATRARRSCSAPVRKPRAGTSQRDAARGRWQVRRPATTTGAPSCTFTQLSSCLVCHEQSRRRPSDGRHARRASRHAVRVLPRRRRTAGDVVNGAGSEGRALPADARHAARRRGQTASPGRRALRLARRSGAASPDPSSAIAGRRKSRTPSRVRAPLREVPHRQDALHLSRSGHRPRGQRRRPPLQRLPLAPASRAATPRRRCSTTRAQ